MMKLLILGGNGQLGKELQHLLKTKNCELGLLPKEYDDCQVISVDKDVLDICSLLALLELVKSLHPNIVVNCAAIANADICEHNPDDTMRVNVLGARNAAVAAQAVGAKLIHISSDYVFGGCHERCTPYKEWDMCAPVNIYGQSKVLSEQYVSSLCSRYFIIRTAWLYGQEGKNFVKTMIGLALEGKPIRVVSDQVGTPTNAMDLSLCILQMAVTSEYGIYHCTNQGQCSWYDFAEKALSEYGIPYSLSPCTTKDYAPVATRAAYSVLDNAMLRCTFGDNMRPWGIALSNYIAKLKENN